MFINLAGNTVLLIMAILLAINSMLGAGDSTMHAASIAKRTADRADPPCINVERRQPPSRATSTAASFQLQRLSYSGLSYSGLPLIGLNGGASLLAYRTIKALHRRRSAMSTAIWLLSYRLAEAARDDYLQWFHEVHVADKLARPGYTWAAHYAMLDSKATKSADPVYIAMFGAQTPRVFLDPSPAQLKLRQSGLTREMMECRIDGRSSVFCEEWSSRGTALGLSCGQAVVAPTIQLEFFDACGHDEDLASWCAQEHMPHFAGSEGCMASRKMIASAGAVRHAVLHEFASTAAAQTIAGAEALSEWHARVHAQVQQPLGTALLGQRLWPMD
jgi:hypothetical protein